MVVQVKVATDTCVNHFFKITSTSPVHANAILYDLGDDDDDGEAWEMSQSGHCPVESIAVSTVHLPDCDNVQQCPTVLICSVSNVHVPPARL